MPYPNMNVYNPKDDDIQMPSGPLIHKNERKPPIAPISNQYYRMLAEDQRLRLINQLRKENTPYKYEKSYKNAIFSEILKKDMDGGEREVLPDKLREHALTIQSLEVLPEGVLNDIIYLFFDFAMHQLDGINGYLTKSDTPKSAYESNLRNVLHYLFLGLSQYGSLMAIDYICQIWKRLDPSSSESYLIESFFQDIAKKQELTLSAWKKGNARKTGFEVKDYIRVLLARLKRTLKHNLRAEYCERILDQLRDISEQNLPPMGTAGGSISITL